MKKLLLIALSFFVAMQPTFADIKSEYNSKRLVIQYYSGVSGSWTEVTESWMQQFRGTDATSTWVFYRGPTPISEAEFLRTAGYQKESVLANRFYAANQCLLVSGMVLGISGLLIAAPLTRSKPIDDPSILIGFAISASAMIPISISEFRRKYWMPLEQAFAIQEEYNQKLLESLQARN